MTPDLLLYFGLTNAVVATLLAAVVWLVTRRWRNPHVAAVLWLVVLLKLVTPPAVSLPFAIPHGERGASAPWSPPTTAEPSNDARREQSADVAESPIAPPGERGASAPWSHEPAREFPTPDAPAAQTATASRSAEASRPTHQGASVTRRPVPWVTVSCG